MPKSRIQTKHAMYIAPTKLNIGAPATNTGNTGNQFSQYLELISPVFGSVEPHPNSSNSNNIIKTIADVKLNNDVEKTNNNKNTKQ